MFCSVIRRQGKLYWAPFGDITICLLAISADAVGKFVGKETSISFRYVIQFRKIFRLEFCWHPHPHAPSRSRRVVRQHILLRFYTIYIAGLSLSSSAGDSINNRLERTRLSLIIYSLQHPPNVCWAMNISIDLIENVFALYLLSLRLFATHQRLAVHVYSHLDHFRQVCITIGVTYPYPLGRSSQSKSTHRILLPVYRTLASTPRLKSTLITVMMTLIFRRQFSGTTKDVTTS